MSELVKQADAATAKPEWVRVKGALQLVQVGHTTLYEWLKDGRVRSTNIRERGAIRGIRLIHVPSLLAYVESTAKQDQAEDQAE